MRKLTVLSAEIGGGRDFTRSCAHGRPIHDHGADLARWDVHSSGNTSLSGTGSANHVNVRQYNN